MANPFVDSDVPPVSVVLSISVKAVVPAMCINFRIPVVVTPMVIVVGPILLVSVQNYDRR